MKIIHILERIRIQRIHVENFRSITGSSFELKDIQLLIGPNNSGKTNLLRAFDFLGHVNSQLLLPEIDLEKLRHKHKAKQEWAKDYHGLNTPIAITVEFVNPNNPLNWVYYYRIEIFEFFPQPPAKNAFDWLDISCNEFIGARKEPLSDTVFAEFKVGYLHECTSGFSYAAINKNRTDSFQYEPSFQDIEKKISYTDASYLIELSQDKLYLTGTQLVPGAFLQRQFRDIDLVRAARALRESFHSFKIYKVEPQYLKRPGIIQKYDSIYSDGSNIVSFLEYLVSSNREFLRELEINLQKCIPDFKEINFYPTEISEWDERSKGNIPKSAKYIMLKDRFGVSHYTEDISEGTLYFLMILSIVLQPNPPQVLMLEEPETGIHPRRITEIMEYFFRLRETNPNIPIILTSHHPYVVDHFKDVPECVWVIDNKEGETLIKNLLNDVIEPQNEKIIKKGMAPINYTESLGEHWAMGFLGGVPETVKR